MPHTLFASRRHATPRPVPVEAPRPPAPEPRVVLERRLANLPVLPTVVSKLMGLDANADGYFQEVRRLIELEPTFSARVLAVANSASSAPRFPITSVRGAVLRLGSVPAANLVLSAAIARVFVPRDDWEKGLWRHALHVALAARKVASASRDPELDPEEAYVCGLLHDLGRFVLFDHASPEVREAERTLRDEALLAAERTLCGMTHAEIGALACSKWRLPEVLTAVVREHHGPPTTKLVALLQLVDAASEDPADDTLDASLRLLRVEARRPPFLQLEPEDLLVLLAEAEADAAALAASLGVG